MWQRRALAGRGSAHRTSSSAAAGRPTATRMPRSGVAGLAPGTRPAGSAHSSGCRPASGPQSCWCRCCAPAPPAPGPPAPAAAGGRAAVTGPAQGHRPRPSTKMSLAPMPAPPPDACPPPALVLPSPTRPYLPRLPQGRLDLRPNVAGDGPVDEVQVQIVQLQGLRGWRAGCTLKKQCVAVAHRAARGAAAAIIRHAPCCAAAHARRAKHRAPAVLLALSDLRHAWRTRAAEWSVFLQMQPAGAHAS